MISVVMRRVVRPGEKSSPSIVKADVAPVCAVYYAYFRKILPYLGKVFANRYEQYRWLPESLVTFPDYRELAELFRECGLTGVKVYPLTGGIAALHIGIKDQEEGREEDGGCG